MFKIYNLLIFEIHIVCIFPTKKKVKKQKLETKGSLEEKKKWAVRKPSLSLSAVSFFPHSLKGDTVQMKIMSY